MTVEVTLYGRPGCHLCDDALEIVERVRARAGFVLRTLDIERDERLFKDYLERIPVIAIDGREAFDLFVDERALEKAVRDAETEAAPQ